MGNNLATMSDLDLWSAVVGFVLPLLIAVVTRARWSSELKGAVTVAACAIGGTMTALLNGGLHGASVIRAALVVAASTVLFYATLWHPSGIAPAIEEMTTPDPKPAGGRR